MRTIKRIVIHHSASPKNSTTVKDIERWHVAEGYDGIGYNRIIEGDGDVVMGRDDARIPAHAYGHNKDSLGICVIGNFEKEAPSQQQIERLVQVLAILCKRYGVAAEAIVGHRDLLPTACPGKNLYNQLPAIRARVAGYLK